MHPDAIFSGATRLEQMAEMKKYIRNRRSLHHKIMPIHIQVRNFLPLAGSSTSPDQLCTATAGHSHKVNDRKPISNIKRIEEATPPPCYTAKITERRNQ
jgi:hypothetical protein